MYIGASKYCERRVGSHWKQFLSEGTAVNRRLKFWFEQLRKPPVFKILEVCPTYEVALQREKFWIKTFWAYEEASCNVTPGGVGGSFLSGKRQHELYPELMEEHGRWLGSKFGQATGKIWGKKIDEVYPGHHQRAGVKGGTTNASRPGYLQSISSLGSARLGITRQQIVLKAAAIGGHNRWHVRRGIKKDGCTLCQEVVA